MGVLATTARCVRSKRGSSIKCCFALAGALTSHKDRHHMARIVEILIASAPNAPASSVQSVRAIPGCGLEGDRYANGTGTFSCHSQRPDGELTLIQQEHVEVFAASSGLAFTARDARRNLVTVGVDLNALIGKEFSVGAVLIRGIRLCEPCNYLAKQTSPDVLRGLVHKGGLRAQILSAGEIRVGDALFEVQPCGQENRGISSHSSAA
jgi:MOSC domain-containing protein YiiM